MVEAQYRARRTILRHAETFTVGTSVRKGVFGILSPTQARWFAQDILIDTSRRPIWGIFVPDNDATVETDLIGYDGMTLVILKIVRRRLRGTLLFKLIVAH